MNKAFERQGSAGPARSNRAGEGRSELLKSGTWLTIVRAFLCICVFASAALVVDYQNPGDPAFCAADSSCMQVRKSDLGQKLAGYAMMVSEQLTLPHLALFAFLAVMAFTFFLKDRNMVFALAGLCGLGACFAGYLIWAQRSMGLYCAYCMLVDVSMIAAAAASVALALKVRDESPKLISPLAPSLIKGTDVRATIAWGIAGTFVTAMPFLWQRFPVNPPVPAQIQALQESDQTVVVMFTDFECPYCRKLHAQVKDELHKPGIKVKRFMVPLVFHPGARPAALAWLCSPEEKRDEIADALYTSEDLTYEGVLKLMVDHGIEDTDAVIACFGSEESDAKITADTDLFFKEIGGAGLPTTWVGSTRIQGARGDMVLAALNRATGPASNLQLPVWMLFATCGVFLLGVVTFTELGKDASASGSTVVPAIGPSRDGDEEEEEEDEEDGEAARDEDDEEEPEQKVALSKEEDEGAAPEAAAARDAEEASKQDEPRGPSTGRAKKTKTKRRA